MRCYYTLEGGGVWESKPSERFRLKLSTPFVCCFHNKNNNKGNINFWPEIWPGFCRKFNLGRIGRCFSEVRVSMVIDVTPVTLTMTVNHCR